jgi:hypothetical protein
VVVVGGGVCSVEIEKGEKKLTFSFHFWVRWVQFSMVVASIILPGTAWVVRSPGECVCGYFLSESKVGRGRDLL